MVQKIILFLPRFSEANKIVQEFIHKYRFQLLIIAIGLVGYWQVAFMQYCLKWDMVDQYFPWRYFVSECLRNGIFPQWNPYQHLGYAIHADPQSGVWYPVVWIISVIYGYDLYASQFDFVLHTTLAGIGMFLLIRHLISHQQVAFLAGCCYMLSGFFIGNAQHLTYIVSGCWIPFIILYYIKLLEKPTAKNAIIAALYFFLLLTGGYPAFTIILAYSLLIAFLWKSIVLIAKKEVVVFKKLIFDNIVFLIFALLLSAGMIVSIFVSYHYITRSAQLPLQTVNHGAFTPQSLWSCLLPLLSAKDPVFFDTDISMSNLYFSILLFAAFIFSFFRKKSRTEKIILAAGIFFLLASFGKYTPVRGWLYDYVPLMNLFRFPSIFRLFALICFIISASFSLKFLLEEKIKPFKSFRLILIVFLIFYGGSIIMSFLKSTSQIHFINYNQFINALDFWQSILMQSIIAFTILIIAFIAWKNPFNKKSTTTISLLILLDIIISAQLSLPITVIDSTPSSVLKRKLATLPHGFPVPENKPAINFSDSSGHISPLWRNLSLLRKEPGFDGYNSFKLKGYEQLSNEPKNFKPLLNNNLVFFSDSYSFYADTIRDSKLLEENSRHLFFQNALKSKIDFKTIKSDSTDKVAIKVFKPNEIEVEYSSLSPQLLTLMQHNYPGWTVSIDGKVTEHFISDYMFISALIPAGKHIVVYTFDNKTINIGFLISVLTLLFVTGFLFKKHRNIPQHVTNSRH